MRAKLKIVVLYALKYLGLFHVSRVLTRRALRILCYHGISLRDEHLFRRKLFMRAETFRRRLQILSGSGCTVLGLAEAVERLKQGPLPNNSVVITFDDGWQGCLSGAFAALRDYEMEATLYLTTYYVELRQPVFDVLIGYILWSSKASHISLEGLAPGLDGERDLSSDEARSEVSDHIVRHGNDHLGAEDRIRLAQELATRLGVDYESIRRDKLFELLSLDEVKRLPELGVDVQLHTHRHRLDLENRELVEKEITENRERLERLLGKSLTQFCYPSGIHHERVYPWLEQLEIESATTTEAGLCDSTSHKFALPRIVDGEDMSEIEFEAELAGMLELVRKLRVRVARPR